MSVTIDKLRVEQEDDVTLKRIREMECNKNVKTKKNDGTVRTVLFREYESPDTNNGNVYRQVVVLK